LLKKSKVAMRPEFWRLYRHLIFGSILVILTSILFLLFSSVQRNTLLTQSNVCADVELSLALSLHGIPLEHTYDSQFDWHSLVASAPYSDDEIEKILLNKKIMTSSLGVSTIVLPDEAKYSEFISLKGDNILPIASLFTQFLKTPLISESQKIKIMGWMECVSYSELDVLEHTMPAPIIHAFVQGEGFSFLWQLSDERIFQVSIAYKKYYQTAIIITIISIAMLIMLVFVWKEFSSLENRRKSFENFTRKIAQGNGRIPDEIPDGSGALKELAYSFDSMSSHIQRLLKVQREMINAISHELRTPIARLRFGLEVIKDELGEDDLMTIEALEGDVEELNTLVDEVLTYGKLEQGSLNLHFEATNIRQLVDGVLQHNSLLLSHLKVEIVFSEEESGVLADAHHMHRALQNLILNAAKYANTRVKVIFHQDEERWQVDIEDDGPGIPFEDRDKVFIPFQRLDNSRTRASGGYGLGLAIVQRIAFWHGGAVLVDESELGGAKFSLIWSRNQHQETLS